MGGDPAFLGFSEDQIKAVQLFFPYAYERTKAVHPNVIRFVHYTSAESAMQIFESSEVWMRNSSCMNDYMEIEHGFSCLNAAYKANAARLKKIFDEIFPGFCQKLETQFNGWLPHFRTHTYVACLSEHNEDEDLLGRLSMWRAYGGSTRVAIVVWSMPFTTPSDALNAYTSPVAYLDNKSFAQEFVKLLDGFESNREQLKAWGEEFVFAHLFNAFRAAAVCTKHPGFSEEREWRITYCPTFDKSAVLVPAIRSIGGVPQQIIKIPLKDIPVVNEEWEHALIGIEIKDLVERIIIGPTEYPEAVRDAFIKMLESSGVTTDDAAKRVYISSIPVR